MSDPLGSNSLLQYSSEQQGSATVLSFAGAISVEVVGQFSRVLQEAASQSEILAIDLRDVGFMNSSGLGALVAAHVSCQRNGRQMVLISPHPSLLEIFRTTQLEKLFRVYDRVEEIHGLQ